MSDDSHEICDSIINTLMSRTDNAQREKMWYRRALYLACNGDKEKVKQMMAATEQGGVSDD